MNSYSLLQTRKFSIKALVRVNSVLKVREEAMQEYGYNLQRDGWLNAFTDEKSQAMRSDGIPWRGAREKHHIFFPSFSLLSPTRMMLLWTGSVV
jgi:hypothetical protein